MNLTSVTRRFADTVALAGVSLTLRPGDVHALLGPNGAGKTTLLRVLAGLVEPDGGAVELGGVAVDPARDHTFRSKIGMVPSEERTFYLRISGYENLLFFARMQGLPKRAAVTRVRDCLELVGLSDSARRRAGHYSNGMIRRLSIARALLHRPAVLLVDEATQGLDPESGRQARELVRSLADDGTAVLWATQRLDEIRSFADTVTVLGEGAVQFTGSVPELVARADVDTYLVRLEAAGVDEMIVLDKAAAALGAAATVAPHANTEHCVLVLTNGTTLGDAIARMVNAGVDVVECQEETSNLELAFLNVVRR